MTIAILSDIHGNLEAFEAVLKAMEGNTYDAVISLGDNIGYGPDPEAVMDRVKRHGIDSVLGNHEMVVQDRRFETWFNPAAQKAIAVCLSQLSEPSKQTIRQLPKSIARGELYFVHGAPPFSPFLYIFQLPDTVIIKKLNAMKQRLIFIGHTHDLGFMAYDGRQLEQHDLKKGVVQLDRNRRYIISAGSVGQPRDGDPSAKYLTYDPETDRLEVHFVPYDAKVTARKIINAGIPAQYADKLLQRF